VTSIRGRGDEGIDRNGRGVTLANWQDPPFNRWAFLHLDELIPMAVIPRGDEPASELERDERDLDDVRFAVGGASWTVGEMLDATWTDAFLVLHDGRIASEWYANGMSPDTLHLTMSVSKSLTSALVGALVGKGRLDTDSMVTSFVPELDGTSFDGCTIQHLLDMRAGTRWNEDYDDFFGSDAFVYEQVMGWRPRTEADLPPDMFAYMRTLMHNDRPHGSGYQYRSILTEALGWVLERAGGASFAQLFSREIWSKLGVEHDAQISVDPGGCAITDGGFCTTLRDLGRFGQMYVDRGRGIVPAAWVARPPEADPELVEAFANEPEAGLYPGATYHDQWWVVQPTRGVFVGLGIYGQMLLVDRSTGSVVVKFSTQPVPIDLSSDQLQIMGSIAACDALSAGRS
jgi:CubicO group peptidase (beta-lactamase class C family)